MQCPWLFRSAYMLCAAMMLNMPAHASVKAISRANCLGFVNESITYDRPGFRSFYGSAMSTHVPWGEFHSHTIIDPDPVNQEDDQPRWRFYAGDTDDAASVTVYGGRAWVVVDKESGVILERGSDSTLANDCNLSEW